MKLLIQTFTAIAFGLALALTLTLTSTPALAQIAYSETDFTYLYNNFRASQADPLPWPGTFWPFDGQGTGSGINHKVGALSPAEKYDQFFGTGGKAAEWEEKNHSCEEKTGVDLENCKGWYGHCNGWTGAALLNVEPDYDHPLTVTNPLNNVSMTFEAHDLKALLSEAWLDAMVSYDGTGTTEEGGAWIFDPTLETAKKPATNNPDITNYEAYWDVSPRSMFYALTNYLGVQKAGLAMDRFTGDAIWNQPILAYRFLPITDTQAPVTRDGHTLYPVNLGLKIYWASDDVDYNYKRSDSLAWDVNNPKFSRDNAPRNYTAEAAQDHTQDGAVVSRYLEMTLFFDAPVKMNKAGTQVVSAGHIIGDGMWAHADPANRAVWYKDGPENSQVQPDFLWRPDSVSKEASYRNPFIEPYKLYKFILQAKVPSTRSHAHPKK